MKTRLLLVFTFAFVIGVFVSCEKNNEFADNEEKLSITKANPKDQYIHANGHIYVIHDNKGKWEHVGYYMRTFYPIDSGTAKLFGVGCYLREGNCGPDVVIIAGKCPTEINDSEDPLNRNYVEISQEVAEVVNNNYSIPLMNSINKGDDAVKSFFFSEMCNKTEFPDQLIEDFKNDLITIKEFPEGIFIVKKGAKKYNEIPEYKW